MGRRRRFSISLAMIVRDEETALPASLASTRGLFDEIIVVDTGSLDRTREVARSFGAAVFEFEWSDDFSAARNVAFSHCNCDYIFWLDADETVSRRAKRRLARLLNAMKEDNIVYLFNQVSHRLDGFIGYNVVLRPRLLPNRFEEHWHRRVYEWFLPTLGVSGVRLIRVNIDIDHHGASEPAHIMQRFARNKRLVELELEADPDDPVAQYNLAMTHHAIGMYLTDRGQYKLAQLCLERLLEKLLEDGAAPQRSTLGADACRLLSRSYQHQLHFVDAMSTCMRGRARYPQNISLLGCEAGILNTLGLWEEARMRWRLMPTLNNYLSNHDAWYKEFNALVSSKSEYAYFLEEANDYYEAAGVWADLARNSAGMFDAVPGLRRTVRRILLDVIRRPRHSLGALEQLYRRMRSKSPAVD